MNQDWRMPLDEDMLAKGGARRKPFGAALAGAAFERNAILLDMRHAARLMPTPRRGLGAAGAVEDAEPVVGSTNGATGARQWPLA